MSWDDYEKYGIQDFFKENMNLLKLLAQSLAKHIINPTTNEALNIIQLHSENSTVLLNKRLMTKNVLLRYLHLNQVPITSNYTKFLLIEKIQNFWKEKFHINDLMEGDESYTERCLPETTTSNNSQMEIISCTAYPIHNLAKKFAEWFYSRWNENTLNPMDFWLDCTLEIRILDQNGLYEDYKCPGNIIVTENLIQIREKHHFFFNPNTTAEGVQGRMDCHGFVMVLSCGTIHIEDKCVGVFESMFGLVRDPLSDNNWKSNKLKILLRSSINTIRLPVLTESETLQDILCLPVSTGDLD